MPIFNQHKTLFIHIPKNGGTSINKTFTNTQEFFYHYDFLYYENLLNNCLDEYHIFSVVRNPFERILSYFLWHINDSRFIKKEVKFKNYPIQVSFEKYIDLMFIKKIKSPNTDREYLTRKTQTEFLLNSNNIIDPRIEIIEFKKIKTKFTNLPHENKKFIDINIKDVYTDETKKFIFNYFLEDFKNFGYNFD